MIDSRAKLHSMLRSTCRGEIMDWPGWRTLARTIERGDRWDQPSLRHIPLRIWMAFFRREPLAMLDSERPDIRDLAMRFKAKDDAEAAMSSIDAVLSSRNVIEAPPGSTAGR